MIRSNCQPQLSLEILRKQVTAEVCSKDSWIVGSTKRCWPSNSECILRLGLIHPSSSMVAPSLTMHQLVLEVLHWPFQIWLEYLLVAWSSSIFKTQRRYSITSPNVIYKKQISQRFLLTLWRERCLFRAHWNTLLDKSVSSLLTKHR